MENENKQKHSTLIVGRMAPGSDGEVARLFGEFDSTEMPALMGNGKQLLATPFYHWSQAI